MAYKISETHPNKRAFITGGGGGLGLALSLALAKDGWTVGITLMTLLKTREVLTCL